MKYCRIKRKIFLGQTDRLQNLLQHAKKRLLQNVLQCNYAREMQNGEKMEFAGLLQPTPGTVLIYILLAQYRIPN